MPGGANSEIILFCGTAEKTTVEYQNVPLGHFGAGLCPVPTVGVSASLRGGLPHQGSVLANFKHVWYYVSTCVGDKTVSTGSLYLYQVCYAYKGLHGPVKIHVCRSWYKCYVEK